MSFRCCEPNLRRRNDECEGGASGMRAACRVPGMAFTAWHDARAAWHVAYSAWHVAYSAWHRGMVRGIAAWFAASRGGTTPAAWAALSARALVRRRDRRVVLIADTQGRARLRHASPGSRHRGMVRDIAELLHAGSRHRAVLLHDVGVTASPARPRGSYTTSTDADDAVLLDAAATPRRPDVQHLPQHLPHHARRPSRGSGGGGE